MPDEEPDVAVAVTVPVVIVFVSPTVLPSVTVGVTIVVLSLSMSSESPVAVVVDVSARRRCRAAVASTIAVAVASQSRLSLSSWPLTCPLDAVVSAVAVSPLAAVGSFARCDAPLLCRRSPLLDPSLVVMPLKARHSDCTKMNEETERSQ
jgi:hypothetical protein